jgi:lipopolysaccharide/colanic/teichoic acid biosynthesis glycosyltransferase
MTLVGPRPELLTGAPYAIEQVSLKPGVTGLWEARRVTNDEDVRRLNLEYARNWSLWRDMRICVEAAIFAPIRFLPADQADRLA